MLSEWLLDWRRTSIFSFAVAEQPPAEASPPSYVDVRSTTPLPSYSAGNPLASQEYAAAPPPYHETTPRDGGVDRVISDNMQRTLWGGSTPEQSPDDLTPPPSYSPR